MKSYLRHLPAVLLGCLFLVFGANFFFKFLPIPSPAVGSPAAMFMGALYGSGYLAFIKTLEILGAICLIIPRTRRLGLLLIGPVIVNILAYQGFFNGMAGILQPPVLLVSILGIIALLSEGKAFLSFLGVSRT